MIAPPLFSIVIPVFREEEGIEACLIALETLKNIERAEVLVVDGHAGTTLARMSDRPRPFALKKLVTKSGRGHQLHSGALEAAGSILVFLHVDTRLRPSALISIADIMTRSSAVAFDLYIRTRNYYTRSVAVIATIRSRMTRIPYGDQVQCLQSDLYHQLGGYRDIPIMEDVDLMTRLKHKGHKIAYAPTFAVNPDRRWKKEGPVRATLRDWYLMLSYRSGRPVENLAGLYRPHIDAKSQK